MQVIIDADEVLQARVAELYKDKTLTNDDRVQRLADLINARSKEVELSDLINARSEEVTLNELIQPIKQAQSQKRKRNPTRAQRISEMKVYLMHQGCYKSVQLRGMTYDEIERLYYRIKRYVDKFIPMGTEETLLRRRMIHKEKKTALLMIR
ncbi:hypothetical protein CTI12_AA315640 [Artemisia annua]|uniref:Uncharacterized protein n=1 Tax=Artemisia annua TaxID=35608 RepID=A0A2U1N2F6_ARTAN|nr:hypothetical protein CTI12_AA315640 [Artemisia annua]